MKKHGKISRRDFTKYSFLGTSILLSSANIKSLSLGTKTYPLRIGGQVFGKYTNPEEWINLHRNFGYSASRCPVGYDEKEDVINTYAQAAQKANLLIAEVGAWSNPISPDEKERKEALEKCIRSLDLADRIGANCCVNVSGSRNFNRKIPDPQNLTDETFEMIVETTRKIIDAVKPTRTFFTLETMPWAFPDSADSYVQLLKAIDRKRFAAHFDPVNLINSPRRYFNNAEIIRECFKKFGSYIKSCHAKDSLIQTKLTTHLDEVRPGLGTLDYVTFLDEVSKLKDVPIMLEHLKTAEEYLQGADYIREIGKKMGLSWVQI